MSEKGQEVADDSLSDAPEESQDQVTLGQLFRAEREKIGATWEDVYQDTRIPVSHLEAIESDDFENMPSEGILKGFVRNYSKFLNLDPDEMIERLTETDPHKEQLVPVSFAGSIKRGFFRDMQGSAIIVGLAIFALIVLITAVAIWWFGTNRGERADGSTTAPVETIEQNESTSTEGGDLEDSSSSDVVSPISPESASSDDESIDDSLTQESDPISIGSESVQQEPSEDSRDLNELFNETDSGSGTTLPFTDSEDDLSQEESNGSENTDTIDTQNEEIPTDDGSHDLEFTFDDITWVQVTDATGDVLVNGVQEADTELSLDGEAPFDIRLGNASAVKLLYRGEEVALGQYTGRNNAAEFTLQP
ncbi:MAG: DUF4115 domain-containing protein [Gammaproteobacteria bacterium]|nr:DUF4115 domain-containing protein [Gammaproteobacteria bacterium]